MLSKAQDYIGKSSVIDESTVSLTVFRPETRDMLHCDSLKNNKSEKRKGLLLERKKILATAKSLAGRFSGSMWLNEGQHIIVIVQKRHERFAEQQPCAAISYSFPNFDLPTLYSQSEINSCTNSGSSASRYPFQNEYPTTSLSVCHIQ
jgi:hypothetical protein